MTLDYIVCGIRTYSMCALVFRRGEARSVARGAGAASDGASARGSRRVIYMIRSATHLTRATWILLMNAAFARARTALWYLA